MSRLLGVVEMTTALLLMASPWTARAGVVGGALAAMTFWVTVSILAALPIWDAGWDGLPALNGVGSFLIKDIGASTSSMEYFMTTIRDRQRSTGRPCWTIGLLGISLVALGTSAGRVRESSP